MTPLSPHFSLEELTFSQIALRRGIINTPNEAQIGALTRLCVTLLEPARTLLGVHLHVDSGFRNPEVNRLVGSTAPHSAHLDGRGADIIPIGMDLHDAFALVRASSLPFDQLIIECNAWLHLAIADTDEPTRRDCLTCTGTPGHWTYTHI